MKGKNLNEKFKTEQNKKGFINELTFFYFEIFNLPSFL